MQDYTLTEKDCKLIQSVLQKGDRVELIPLKDGFKIIHVRRYEVKK